MPTGVTDDYTGRTIDLESLQTVENIAGVTPLALTLRENGLSRHITGIQKLAQRYATLLLTQQSTVGYDALQGANFIGPATSGQIANSANLAHFFNVANFQVIRQLQQEDNNTKLGALPPDDERIRTAKLVDFEVNEFEGTLSIKVALTTLAGDNYIYVLPGI